MESRYIYILRYTLALTDLLLLNFCLYLAYMLNQQELRFDANFYRYNLVICNLIWLLSTTIFKLYYQNTLQNIERVYRTTWKSIALHIFLFSLVLFDSSRSYFPTTLFLAFYTKVAFGFLLSRFISTWLLTIVHRSAQIRKRVAVLEMSNGGLKLADYLTKQNSLRFVGFLDSLAIPLDNSLSIAAHSAKAYIKSAAESGIEEVYIPVNPNNIHDLNDYVRQGEKYCIRLKFVPDLTTLEPNFKFDTMGNFTVLSARNEPLESMHNRFKKRLFDVIVSLGVIVFIFSWLYPILALIIKIQSPGPVFFAQLRTGRNNKPFWCYKFRSMRMNNDSNTVQATRNDDRVTSIGKFMRRTSLDEFPQFFNVLMGYMSIIGPRPHMLSHTDEYRKIIDKYMTRQFLKPGISGWAQVNGYRGETKENSLMERRVEHDIWYMENWTLMLDLRITFLTIINVLKGDENSF